MEKTIANLAKARAATAEAREKVDEIKAEIAASELGRMLAQAESDTTDCVAAENLMYEKARGLALDAFAEDGDKHPHPAITVGEYTVAQVAQPGKLREHCLEHLRDLLIVDEKAAINYAKKLAVLPGISIYTERRAKVKTDLSAWLLKREGDDAGGP